MKRRRVLSCVLSALLLCSCAGGETLQTEQPESEVTTAATTSAPQTEVTSVTTRQTTTAETTTTTILETAPTETEQPVTEPVDFSEYFYFDYNTSDYAERFCDWYFDSSCVLQTEQEFLHNGGTKEILAAGENAVRASEDFRAADEISQTAELRDDGDFYYTVDGKLDHRFSLSDELVDEKGRAQILFNSAVADDFDGDGSTEFFLLYNIPYFEWLDHKMQCLVFVDKNGNAEYLTSGVGGYLVPIRYKDFTHIAACFGVNIISHYMNIYALENGAPQVKRTAFGLGSKLGIAMSESEAQAPGSWLVVWDNIDKKYKEIKSEPAPKQLINAIYYSSFADELKANDPSFGYSDWDSAEELGERLRIYGGKYLSYGLYNTFEYNNGFFTESYENIIDSAYDADTIIMSISAAEKHCKTPPYAPAADYAPYEISTEGVYDTAEEFAKAAPDILAAAEDIVYQSKYYKKLSYQLEHAEKNGNIYTFNYCSTDAVNVPKTYQCNFDSAFFEGDKAKPLFKLGAYDDFDGDGKKEAFIAFRLPYPHYFVADTKDKSDYEIEMLVYVSDKGGCVETCDYFHTFDKFRLIKYGDETHLLINEKWTYIYSVRYGEPCYEICSVEPNDDGVSFGDNTFYDTDLNEYCRARYVEMSRYLLDKLNESAAFKEQNGDKKAEKAWIAGGSYIVTDSCGSYRWDGEEFTFDSSYGGYSTIAYSNEEYLTQNVTFFPMPDKNTEFIDYKFTENYPAGEIPQDMQDKAVAALKASKYYTEASGKLDLFDDEQKEKYIVNGSLEPQFNKGYIEDFDGDGKKEAFLYVDMPMNYNTYYIWECSFLIFCGSGGDVEILADESGLYDATVLDYGGFKHIILGGYGTCGAEDHYCVWGVYGGKAKQLVGARASYGKFGCFLTSYGWQSMGAMMYFDTAKEKYISVEGVSVPYEQVKALDKDNVLAEFDEYLKEDPIAFGVLCFGGRYYSISLSVMDGGSPFVCEDGRLKSMDTWSVRSNHFSDDIGDTVRDVDIDGAFASMKKVG
ncbi:MAG: hypothetical protein ACI4JF_06435 [Oscillospiraceae bacterium]